MFRLALALLSLFFALQPVDSLASEYRLGPQDKVRLIVSEWRPSRAETYTWTPLNAEFTVSSAGMLSLPLVGNIKAESLTLEQLSNAVSDHLQRKMGLVDRPSASIEVSQFRPFYITGDVANPGEFPFRPGLSVLKALSLAGGTFRPLGVSAAGLERDSTLARGDLRVMVAERTGLLAKRARLKAESDDQPRIDFPADLVGRQAGQEAADAAREEQMIFESRRNYVRSKIESFKQAKTLLDREIATLATKDASLDKQFSLALSERQNVQSLAGKGLVVSTRQLTTEQTVAQIESARLDISIARVRAEQDRTRIDRSILELQDQRRAEILLELRQIEAKLNEIREKIRTNERLAFNAEVATPAREDEAGEQALALQFTIVRSTPERTAEIDATSATQVEPGDVVQVRRRRQLPYRGGGPASLLEGSLAPPPATVTASTPGFPPRSGVP